MSDDKRPRGRRTFLVGLLTGTGAVAALAGAPGKAAARKEPAGEPGRPDPVLYRRTEETDRYYRTLYRA